MFFLKVKRFSGNQFVREHENQIRKDDKPELDKDGKPQLRRTTAVHLAVKYNGYFIIPNLFKIYNSFDVNYMDESGLTHFHVACEFGISDVVEKFLELGQDPNCLSEGPNKHDLPLHLALAKGRKEVVRLLLRNGADPNLANLRSLTPLDIFRDRYDDDDHECMEIFFEINKDGEHRRLPVQTDVRDKMGNTPLHLAMSHVCENLTRLLLNYGADPHSVNAEGSTPLHIIYKIPYEEENILRLTTTFFEICNDKHQTVQVDARDNFGQTPLHCALEYYRMNSIELLLRYGASPNSADFDFVGKVAQFLVLGQDPNCHPQKPNTSSADPPLRLALRTGSERIAQLLLKSGADTNLPDDGAETPMHIVCNLDFGCGDLAEILYKTSVEKNKPIEVNARDESGRTPLHYALKQERVKEVGFLLSHGADPNIADDEEETPLHVIAKTSCDDNLMGQFFKMCDDKDLQLQVNPKNNLNRTPLQWAVANLLPNSVDLLLDRGADLSSFVFPTKDYFAETFLHDREIRNLKKFPIKLASDAMAIVDHLEKRDYELQRSDALTIMKTFAEYGVFKIQDLQRSGPEYEKFVMEAREHMMNADLSLYDLMQLQPEEAEQRLTYADYTRFVDSNFEFPKRSGRVYVSHLSEMITRGFCRRWATKSFLEVTRNNFLSPCGYKDEPDIDDDGRPASRRTTPIHQAAKYNAAEFIIPKLFEIYDRFDVNYTDESGFTHFHAACQFGCEDVVKKFLEQGQDPNCFPQELDSSLVDPPLCLVLKYGHFQMFNWLLKSGVIRTWQTPTV
ncbi:unnamed protein product [Trichogramma brassicae]|uniref:Uncharacterized protein n=1 Tax=Trichogramma brassicae TaxID=86971 RepID=A0A6H5J165_9HYME|nr:unnamed protein product [Trichogramma brassicae]